MSTKAKAAERSVSREHGKHHPGTRGKSHNVPAAEAKVRETMSPLLWRLWNASSVDEWSVPPLEWIVEGVIQRDALGFLSGPPKVGKSFVALDLCDTITRGSEWLGRYQCHPVNILYIAREDPARRVRDRLLEIQQSKTA